MLQQRRKGVSRGELKGRDRRAPLKPLNKALAEQQGASSQSKAEEQTEPQLEAQAGLLLDDINAQRRST